MRRITFWLCILLLPSFTLLGQSEKRAYQTGKIIQDRIPQIDGQLNDPIWELGDSSQWESAFIQYLPNENNPPSEKTYFKIVYDARYLYVAFLCKDSHPQSINQRMSRRDGYDGDWVEITLDSYHDLRTAFAFSVSAAGVKSDKLITLNGQVEDLAWNPIWYAKSQVNQDGWTAELKIPFSQLRFGQQLHPVWGMQIQRRILRLEERSVWQRIPQGAPGWVSEFGKLNGLSAIKPQRQLEIQPFIVASLQTFEKEPENPYRSKDQTMANVGLDGKVGITNDLTLDFTINPDFGQVEADPAAIALDGFQLFFAEQRPFFIENKNIFDYRFSAPSIGGIYSSDNLFYSRRIGRKPQGNVQTEGLEYVDIPSQSTILGAVKFSGKTQKGLSLGILESLTAAEYAAVGNKHTSRKELIEPLTNYLVARVQKDFNQKQTFLGGILTSVLRQAHGNTSFLHDAAHSGGIDLFHQWKERTWYLGMNLVMSQVNGSPTSILNTQTSIPHLFQREGAKHLVLDSARMQLSGTGGDLKIGRTGNHPLQFETGVNWRSPQLELNDLGFMREADLIQHYLGMTYRSLNSFGGFRNASIAYKHWMNWDFSGALNYIDWDIELNATMENNWSYTIGYFSQPHIYTKSLLQGGPRMRLSDQYGFWWGMNSDNRKKLSIQYNGWTKTGGQGSYFLIENGLRINYQALDRFLLSFAPRFTIIRHRLQYNTSLDFRKDKRYIVSLLDQNTLSLALRLDLSITPNLAIQYYAEPFVSIGEYQNFAFVKDPLATFSDGQLHFYEPNSISAQGHLYKIDEDQDGIIDYDFEIPSFSYFQLRSNLVLRYEYIPGSEIYLVWAQGAQHQGLPTRSLLGELERQLLKEKTEHTFLVKLTYRFHK